MVEVKGKVLGVSFGYRPTNDEIERITQDAGDKKVIEVYLGNQSAVVIFERIDRPEVQNEQGG